MRKRGQAWFRIAFLAPALILYGFFVLIPLVQSFQLAFYRLSGLSTKRTFVGWDNFETIWKNGIFTKALGNNLQLLVGGVVLVLLLAYPLAMAAHKDGKLARFLRSVYLFPHVISLVVVGILWQFIFNPTMGLLTSGLTAVGFENLPPWLGDRRFALPAVLIAFLWYGLGFWIMVLQAGLKGIPADVTEAAALDGASGWRKFASILWPLTWPTRRIVVLHTSIGALNTFALVRLMTQGGPDRASEVTLTYLFERGFQPNSYYGEATAIALLNFLVVMLVVAGMNLLFGRNPVESKR
jgi:N-acetylglucosamine transport system permease protein